MTRRNKILVPEAREGLDQLKHKIIQNANQSYQTEQADDLAMENEQAEWQNRRQHWR